MTVESPLLRVEDLTTTFKIPHGVVRAVTEVQARSVETAGTVADEVRSRRERGEDLVAIFQAESSNPVTAIS